MTDRDTILAALREEVSACFNAATFYAIFSEFNFGCNEEYRRQTRLAVKAMKIASYLTSEIF